MKRYKNLFPEVLEYLEQSNLSLLSLGKHEISHNIFVLVNEYETNSNDIGILENHRKYIDFQIVLSGTERMALCDSHFEIFKQYDDEADYELVKAKPYFIDLKPDCFVVLYPNEYHHPGININNPQKVRKIVFKIKI
ncbi:YhcH/YjgK/YiaL family protein [Maribellus maritimus]|nr:YhcH/YjgK/YiaL family protein [Maribellus maritimus]